MCAVNSKKMKFVPTQLILIVFLRVIVVKGECDTYLGCLGSFFGSFFKNYGNIRTATHVKNITVPGFDNIHIENDSLDSLLSGVSSFIEEELDGDVNFGPQFNIFQNLANNTAIYVKTITINNNFGEFNNKKVIKNISLNDVTDPGTEVLTTTQKATMLIENLNKLQETSVTDNVTGEVDKNNKKLAQNEIFDDTDPLDLYYDSDEDNSTDYLKIDYLEMYKDTTNEYLEFKPTEISVIDVIKVKDDDKGINSSRPAAMFEKIKNNSSIYVNSKCSNDTKDVSKVVFPWIAAIFIKNDTSDQFDYYCDGALLSENIVITAARCMEYYGSAVEAVNLLVLLGKSSLQTMSGNEKAVKVKSVIVHENFTADGAPQNDIAILLMDSVTLNDNIQTACLGGDGGEGVTAGWALTGELVLIPFKTGKKMNCDGQGNNTFCAVYGNDVTVCPSYGGIYASKDTSGWYLQGIRSADPSDRGLCFDRTVTFTYLRNYMDWIRSYL